MNWKLRLKNKTTLITLIAAAVSMVYQLLAMFNVAPAVTEEALLSVAALAVNMLCLLGIVVDPTTKGVADSKRALSYSSPADDGESER